MNRLFGVIREVLFYGAFLLVVIAAWEKLINIFGYEFLRKIYTPCRLLEFAVICAILVIMLQLREMLAASKTKN
jgi:hypothetical protein